MHDESPAENGSYKESRDDIGLIEWNVALDLLNIFAIAFYQSIYCSFWDTNEKRNKIANQGQ